MSSQHPAGPAVDRSGRRSPQAVEGVDRRGPGPRRESWRESVSEDPLGLTRHFAPPRATGPARAPVDSSSPSGSPAALIRPLLVLAAILLVGYLAGVEQTVILVLALLTCIVLHELGHYLTAKWGHIKVTEFFVGFGPRLWAIRRGETEYGVRALPLGGYCRIIGMHNLEEVDPADEARTYRQAPLWRRLSVAVAGSTMHFLIAICLLFALFFWVGDNGNYLTTLPANQPIVNIDALTNGSGPTTTHLRSPAQEAGFKVGDRVVSINGHRFADYNAMHAFIQAHAGQRLAVTVQRDGHEVALHPVPVNLLTLVAPASSPIVSVAAGGSSIQTSEPFRVGDRIVSVEGHHFPNFEELRSFVAARPGQDLAVVVRRAGSTVDLGRIPVKLSTLQVAGPQGSAQQIARPDGFLGIEVSPTVHSSFGASLSAAAGAWVHVSALTLGAFGHLVTLHGITTYVHALTNQQVADSPTDQVRFSSPVGVVRLFHQASTDGAATELWLLAVINISVGLFNLIPLLPLDGGHVAIALYEGARSRRGRRYHADVAKLLPLLYLTIGVLGFLALSSLFLDLRDLSG
jgi:membrane-associated protease RseP (regulator of RpoE activity)